jgi:hypothetical protein
MPALVVGVLPNFSALRLTWALPRSVATYHLREQGFAYDLTNPCKVLALPTTIFICSLSILPCLVPQVVTNLGPVT